jgi:hypothetical protein
LIYSVLKFIYLAIRHRYMTIPHVEVLADAKFRKIVFVVFPGTCVGIVQPSRTRRRGIYFPLVEVVLRII